MNPFDRLTPNYLVVDTLDFPDREPTQLVRGPRPDMIGMRQLLKQFGADINLEVGWFELFFNEHFVEHDICEAIDVAYIHKPMSDVCPPTTATLRAIVAKINYYLTRGHVLVHCLHGEDRTGMVCAAYRIIVNKWSANAAIEEMYAQGFHKIPYFYWVPVLQKLFDERWAQQNVNW